MRNRTRIVLGMAVIWAVLLVPPPPSPGQAKAEPKVVRRVVRIDTEELKKARHAIKLPQPTTKPATQPTTRPAARPATKPATQPAKADSLKNCLALYMRGRYSDAAKGYRGLLAKRSGDVRLGVGLAGALAMTGEYKKALDALKSVAARGQADADWHVTMAKVLGQVGRYEEALSHAVKANELKPRWAPTILARGQLLEVLGRKEQARGVYKTMAAVVAEDAYRQDARSLVALGKILDREGVLSRRKASEQAANILHNYLQRAYMEVDKQYWPAHLAAGDLLLGKHRAKQAAKEFELALKLNQRLPDAHVGMGVVALSAWRFETCLGACDEALKVNPKHTMALILKAVCLMQWRKFDQVPAVLEQALKINPNHPEALSLMAAVHVRTHQAEKAKPYIERVGKIDPGSAGLPNTIAEWLAAGRQFEEAEKYYRQAIKLAPEMAEPVANLGRLYMQTGQEKLAKETLEKAHEIDDFRADVYNFLRLLRKMEDFKAKETDHFIVKVDPKYDEVLLEQVSAYLERIHKEVAVRDFEHEPPAKTLVEIFPTHDQFSVRITGRGWIGTIGACTGRVIAVVAPSKERSQFGTFNWASVLRHEYTHTVTLSTTKNRIPHWFTEACAVWEQPDRRSYEAVQKLVGATRMGRLLPIKELNWGFIRPKRRGDRGLAYAQAEWIMEYIIEKKGYPAILKMLKGFRDGLTQEKVFKTCLNTTEADFDKAFRTWAKKQVEAWGFNTDPLPDLRKAAKAAKDKPKDAVAQADLAVALYIRGQAKAAEAAARKALELDRNNVRALAVLARLLVARREHDEAIEIAQRLESVNRTSKTAPRVLADCYWAKRQWAQAISALELLKARMPLDGYSFERLASLYTQLGQIEKALPNLMELHRRTMKDPQYARQVAEAYRAMGKDDLALRYFEEIAYINPYEASAYEAMASVHRNARRYDQAVRAIQNVCLLQPKSADAWAKMAMMRYLAGKAAKDTDQLRRARQDAEKAIQLDPDSQARRIIEYIDAVLETLKTSRAG